MTIQQVIDLILKEVPDPLTQDTVDTFKSGDPTDEVTGIVTTFITTFDVLHRAKQLGANLVITHEPTYYSHRDETEQLAGDPVFEAKRRFLEDNRIAVWRFHDNWHRHHPDGIVQGLANALGWTDYQSADDQTFFQIPPTPLRDLAAALKEKLHAQVCRVAGEPQMICSGIATSVGCGPWAGHHRKLRDDRTDALICGESNEWQACEYVRDARTAGRPRALVVLGHCNSEEPGMAYLAQWLGPRVPGVEVAFVPAGDPFWPA